MCSKYGQAIYRSVYGRITDSTGLAIATATITVKGVTRGIAVRAPTNSLGDLFLRLQSSSDGPAGRAQDLSG